MLSKKAQEQKMKKVELLKNAYLNYFLCDPSENSEKYTELKKIEKQFNEKQKNEAHDQASLYMSKNGYNSLSEYIEKHCKKH